MVSFTSHTVNPFLFDLLWQSVLQKPRLWMWTGRHLSKNGIETGPPGKTSSKTSSLLFFPGQFLLQCRGGSCYYYPPFRLRPSEMVSVTPKPGSCYSLHPSSACSTTFSVCDEHACSVDAGVWLLQSYFQSPCNFGQHCAHVSTQAVLASASA